MRVNQSATHCLQARPFSLAFASILITLWGAMVSLAYATDPMLELGHDASFITRLAQPKPLSLRAEQNQLSASEVTALKAAKVGQIVRLQSLEQLFDSDHRIRLRRIDLYADNAVLVVDGKPIRPDRTRHFFVGDNDAARVALSFDPLSETISSHVHSAEDVFSVEAEGGLLRASKMAPSDHQRICENDLHAAVLPPVGQTTKVPSRALATTHMYEAGIAIDTDNEFLDLKFENNTSAAQRWIEDMFVIMNAFYVPDLSLELKISYLRLRVAATDPNPAGFNDSLGNFINHWENTPELQSVDRVFAALLAGFNGGFSGIAALGPFRTYCGNRGYSLNRLGSSEFVDAEFAAGGVGHEIGHNLGSDHTHCERLAPGGNFIDECYGSEAGCFSGTPSCPADGSGTLMSYCNPNGFGPPGCAAVDEFHPLIIDKLVPFIMDAAPSCITLANVGGDDPLFADGFEN